ncbi:hypothetical protein VTO42DRAFT_6211 [Malbranchea cinnamomea]
MRVSRQKRCQGEPSDTSKRAEMLRALRAQLEQEYQKAVDHMTKYYSRKRKPMAFAPGDKALLSTRNFRTLRPSKKLGDQWCGPFEVLEPICTHAYRSSCFTAGLEDSPSTSCLRGSFDRTTGGTRGGASPRSLTLFREYTSRFTLQPSYPMSLTGILQSSESYDSTPSYLANSLRASDIIPLIRSSAAPGSRRGAVGPRVAAEEEGVQEDFEISESRKGGKEEGEKEEGEKETGERRGRCDEGAARPTVAGAARGR